MNQSKIMITQFPKISAIYYGLIQSGYDYYSIERKSDHIDCLKRYIDKEQFSGFFAGTRQETCKVYPYWPRAAILENATFYLSDDNKRFHDFELFRRNIMSASNISDDERSEFLWDWIRTFPKAIGDVLHNWNFIKYIEYEKEWIREQNDAYFQELNTIKNCLEICISKYKSPVQDIKICINPIKCVYSADYYLVGSTFIFTSGAFNRDSIIHEFLHHVVHPIIKQEKTLILEKEFTDSSFDDSYYLSGGNAGRLNAFEEIVVRSLTKAIAHGKYPSDMRAYVGSFLR